MSTIRTIPEFRNLPDIGMCDVGQAHILHIFSEAAQAVLHQFRMLIKHALFPQQGAELFSENIKLAA
jgi:hypothetical protein